MQNVSFSSARRPSVLVLIFSFLLAAANGRLLGQTFCHTVPGPGAIGALDGSANLGNAPGGPHFIRIYVHVVRRADGTGGQTPEQVREALSYLDRDFNPHNIFFVQDCETDYIDNDFFYNSMGTDEIFLWNPHGDGIDIYLFRDQVPGELGGHGKADGIGAGSFYIFGNFWKEPYGPLARSYAMSHEMAHCLGLYHTHEALACREFVDMSNCSSCGDYVCDTPADACICFENYPPDCNWDRLLYDSNGDRYAPDVHNIMGYTHLDCMEYFSEGQAERMRQAIAILPILQACVAAPDFPGYFANLNSTWTVDNTPNNGDFLIEGDLVINWDVTLAIEAGVTVHFGEQSRLIIMPNARLVLGGTLTGMGCKGYTWQGVKVWGSAPDQHQFPVNGARAQGRIECLPGSVIENAKVGIQLYGPSYTLAGGQIDCVGATIRNCPVGVEFAPYQNFMPSSSPDVYPRSYFGSFEGVRFLTDDAYPHGEPFHSFVLMTGVNGIKLSGCSYVNERAVTGGNIENRGYGIFANDAGFSVMSSPVGDGYPQDSFLFSEFYGLGYGIYTARIVTNRPYIVRYANFESCFVGIRNKSVSGSNILFNKFNLGELPADDPASDQVGVIFEMDVAGFACEENEFVNTGGNADATIGVICINTGSNNKVIRRNKFDNLTIGNLANQVNASLMPLPGLWGLYYECNENYNTQDRDFSVPNGRIRSKQGKAVYSETHLVYHAAGNRFSYTGVDFSNFGTPVEYFYYKFGQNEEPLVTEGNFDKSTANQNACLPAYCEPPCHSEHVIQTIKNDYHRSRSAYQAARSDYSTNPVEENARRMAFYRRGMDEAANTVLLHLMYDTAFFNTDTLHAWIGNLSSIEGDLWLAGERLSIGKAASAMALLDEAGIQHQLTGDELTDVNNYQSIISLLDGKPFYALEETTLQSVADYLQATGYAEGWAKSIMMLHGGHFPPEYTKGGTSERPSGDYTAEQADFFVVRPNPASDFVDFQFSVSSNHTNVSIHIFDMNGRQVKWESGLASGGSFTWYTKGNPAGVYFYQLVVDGAVWQRGRVILSK
ncbi:MAG: zinc-dependent metalloprotease [Phaeodactylibacter sp.]|nr:zinc-dependent metalloprotease [Phaeodactylibacter sp.]